MHPAVATAEQILSLIRSHTHDDAEHFYTVALQIASYEARRGHQAFADGILKYFADASQKRRSGPDRSIPEELRDVLILRHSDCRLSQLVVNQETKRRIKRIMREYVQQEVLKLHGLTNRRKILLMGPPGTGKTMTAAVLAHELHLPLVSVQLDLILSRYMGESSAKLHQVFEYIANNQSVYLFDEFDTLAGDRNSNDIGEMRRVLNTLLVRIEQDKSDSILVSATNMPEVLDKAIFRRYDDCIEYALPDKSGIVELIKNTLATFITDDISPESLSIAYSSISCADVVSACHDAVKESLMDDKPYVTQVALERAFSERVKATKLKK